MKENELFVLGGPETQLHDIFWAVHDEKSHGRSEGEENIGPGYGGWSGPSDACFSRTHTRVGARGWALTNPEQSVRLLNPSDCTAGYTLLNPSDRSIWLLTEPDRVIPLVLLLTEADRTCYLLPLMNSECCWGGMNSL